jgi:hypothetical protein
MIYNPKKHGGVEVDGRNGRATDLCNCESPLNSPFLQVPYEG